MVALRKNLSVEKGERVLFDDVRYFFYITNDRESSAAEIVVRGQRPLQPGEPDRPAQERRVAPCACRWTTSLSNWAYMVMASLAWSLKAWCALLLPENGRWREKYKKEKGQVLRMEFKKFVNSFVRMPAQIIRTGRRIVFRLLNYNPYQSIFVRLLEVLDHPLRC